MAVIFDGRAFAAKKILKLDKEVAKLKNRGIHPRLASIIVGEDPASLLYVSLKKKRAEGIGAEMDVYYLKGSEKFEDILLLIKTLNLDSNVHGIMVQLPLPGDLDKKRQEIINAISPKKDVDGLRNNSPFLHPTSKAVVQIIKEAKKKVEVKNNPLICVVGSTGMVGKPLVMKLKKEDYKVTECHETTGDVCNETKEADILVSTTGKPGLIRADMVKEGAVIIDVGSPRGDVDFEEVLKKASFITPVPGGVGPVTISCLLENLVSAC